MAPTITFFSDTFLSKGTVLFMFSKKQCVLKCTISRSNILECTSIVRPFKRFLKKKTAMQSNTA